MVSSLHIPLQRSHHAWLLYRRDSRGTRVPAKEQMALGDFKLLIADCLSIQTAKTGSKKTRKTKC